MNEETKQETSIPVSARVSFVRLAQLAKFYEVEGYRVRSMSQLVGWGIDLLVERLIDSGMVEDIDVAEADKLLREMRLYQRESSNRGRQKIATALRFDSMRKEGIDPRSESEKDYNILHNARSVDAQSPRGLRGEGVVPRMVQLEGYPEGYVYPEGDEGARDRLIKQCKGAGIKSDEEKKAEAVESGKKEGLIKEE